uniref:Uncharacterized protein n=1 Tax=Sinocyclocheilus rhinocerous TaxID=307959 RepID=A0A673G505_9TELE
MYIHIYILKFECIYFYSLYLIFNNIILVLKLYNKV